MAYRAADRIQIRAAVGRRLVYRYGQHCGSSGHKKTAPGGAVGFAVADMQGDEVRQGGRIARRWLLSFFGPQSRAF